MSSSSSFLEEGDRPLVWRYIFAGLCASLDSIGLARFAFTPLVPELIRNQWFPASAVMYLGAANLAGYVLGALIGRAVASRLAGEHMLRLMMVLITAAFFACCAPLSFAWYFGWRFLSGIAGGIVMVLVVGTILPHVPPARKGIAGGTIFLGLGLGIAGSGTVIPLFLELGGLVQAWIGLGVISVVLTAVSWRAWPPATPAGTVGIHGTKPSHAVRFGWGVRLLYAQYVLMAAAAVPPMMFLVDFVARGLGKGTHLGSVFWAIYGLGAIAGPPLYGHLADRIGPRAAVRGVVVLMALVFFGLYVLNDLAALGVLALIVGTFAPGMVPLLLARIHLALTSHVAHQNLAWTRASAISAAGLAAAAYAFSALFNATGGNHRLLFLVSAGMLVVALLADLGTGHEPRPRVPGMALSE